MGSPGNHCEKETLLVLPSDALPLVACVSNAFAAEQVQFRSIQFDPRL